MDAADAVARVEAWLGELNRAAPGNPVRVDPGAVVRNPEGWYVPYNSIAFLDDGQAGRQIFPPPAIIVREPDGELRFAHPYAGGVSSPVRLPGQPFEQEDVDPYYAESGLGRLGVPRTVVLGWRRLDAAGNQIGYRLNPDYRPGPLQRGFPAPENQVEALVLFAQQGWIDRDMLLAGLVESEVFLEASAPHELDLRQFDQTRRELRVFAASRYLPPDARASLRYDMATLFEHTPDPDTTYLLNIGWTEVPVPRRELAQTLAVLPRRAPRVHETGMVEELTPELEELAARTAAEAGLPEPEWMPPQAGPDARRRGYELTFQECCDTVRAVNWLKLPDPDVAPPSQQIARTNRYRADGSTYPVVDTFGKYQLEPIEEVRYGWHRVVGAYVGFAIGEALGSAVDGLTLERIHEEHGPGGLNGYGDPYGRPGRIGPLTQQLLFLTEGVIRSPYRGEPSEELSLRRAVQHAWCRWVNTQGIPWPKADGLLSTIFELRASRDPDPAEFAAARALVLGTPQPPIRGAGVLVAALPAALTLAGSETGSAARAARLAAGVLYRDETDLDAVAYLATVFQGMLTKETYSAPAWVIGREVLGPESDGIAAMVAESMPDFRAGQADYRDPEQIGDGHSALSVLGRAFAAITGFENRPAIALRRAVNHSGRSALTGALVGAFLGARTGLPGLPAELRGPLEFRALIENLATDAVCQFDRTPPPLTRSDDWLLRYPRG
ncbi:ADP-ribosylglycohydrolase family protein [Actinokineospora sp. UTMC 2448]|uniref:ADP-ribosylglycohydrolase family protein n=1 Tax=Actinokineospora sp. UTMC 2448 TaxID=2268449 RepID=UPI002164863D|nr:ADP-ribosylglycohydrolase family protein [Actinokineospora sp. UTMC 2448]UVS78593.1 ADP-ribosyl-[dinitrogen reductase] hydrolase [Actinokineospora sp. UTMC 2448]